MKKWLILLRQFGDLFFWELYTPAGNLICRSILGFTTEEEARRDLADFHPPEHF